MPVLRSKSYELATGPVAASPVGGKLLPVSGGVTSFSDGEVAEFVALFTKAAEQRRDKTMLRCDPILMRVAQAKALDMANRRYFSHTNPDGMGPNFLIRQAGYRLSSAYGTGKADNNTESIAAGMMDGHVAWEAWLRSAHHRPHLTGEADFFREQVDFGIGRAVVEGSPYRFYWCFLSART